jgi:hypothetical protein
LAGGDSCVGVVSLDVVDSCAGAGSLSGADSGEAAGGSCEGAADSGEDEASVLACGGSAGGRSECVVVVDGALACAPDRFALFAEVVSVVLPGKAFAAASASTPVRTTLPATSQRLIR